MQQRNPARRRTTGGRWCLAAGLALGGILGGWRAQAYGGTPPDICETNPCSSGCPLEGTLCCRYGPACCGAPDCNGNGMTDACDLERGFSRDCDTDGTPDECDAAVDCEYAEFVYDALGRRIAKVQGAVTTQYYYDGQNVLEETDGAGALERYFVNGTQYIDERVLMHEAWSTPWEFYYLERELHSVSGLAGSLGELFEWYEYGAYGDVQVRDGYLDKPLSQSKVDNPYYFTGRELDFTQPAATSTGTPALQLYHYRARGYDAANGRFDQRDPREYTDGPNLYTYAKDSPSLYSDPSGKRHCNIRMCRRHWDPTYKWIGHSWIEWDQGGGNCLEFPFTPAGCTHNSSTSCHHHDVKESDTLTPAPRSTLRSASCSCVACDSIRQCMTEWMTWINANWTFKLLYRNCESAQRHVQAKCCMRQ